MDSAMTNNWVAIRIAVQKIETRFFMPSVVYFYPVEIIVNGRHALRFWGRRRMGIMGIMGARSNTPEEWAEDALGPAA